MTLPLLAAALAVAAAEPRLDPPPNAQTVDDDRDRPRLVAGVDPFAGPEASPAPPLRILIRPTRAAGDWSDGGIQANHAGTSIDTLPINVLYELLGLRELADEPDIVADLPDRRYDLIWSVPKSVPRAERVALLRAAGTAFFGVTIRVETRTVPTLTLNRADGAKPPPDAEPGSLGSGSTMRYVDGTRSATLHGTESSGIANLVRNFTQRPTFDETGLDGRYDIDLKWREDGGISDPSDVEALAGALKTYGLTLEREDRPLTFAVVENRDDAGEQ